MKKPRAYTLLLEYSFRLLARKQYSETELRKKLLDRGKQKKLPDLPVATAQVVDRLKELNYIDDTKLIDNYLTYSLPNRLEGKAAFLFRMQRKGVVKKTAIAAWEAHGISEETLARALIDKMLPKLIALKAFERKRRLAGLLARRGFKGDIIWKILASSDSALVSCK